MHTTTSSSVAGTSPAGSSVPDPTASDPVPTSGERALVLGGGGSTGNAWLIGVVAGLADSGLDVSSTADLTVGTSAGATTAAQLAGATPAELYAAALVAPTRPQAGPGVSSSGGDRTRQAAEQMARTAAVIAGARDAADMRRRLGEAALALPSSSDEAVQSRWRSTVAARLPDPSWPRRSLLLTAVDARTGESAVFDRQSAVDLVDAVAASCASGFAYRVGEGQYIDGGYRRNENADLAAGHRRVLVLSPFGGRTRAPLDWGLQLSDQVDELRERGSEVEVIAPGSEADRFFGPQAMDLSLRPAAAEAGYERGTALAERVAALWC
ncbi:patatin-like phospholipase family protein [Cellulosimicrobium sp. SH8]|uniref:patatin-like phospholipase family protein n=1 Tax=Cellulosimicrobium sp. SH8 TaxID=2952936 RepID=UPI0021F27B41|nr:patatin-like phospholipase family protein [Cellulosimicrobium sp. SH8]